jgi:hypothetical protein
MHPSLQCLASGPLTILAYGALLSERSAQLTFPKLRNFRLARVQGYRRVFAHPHFFLISQGIVDPTSSKRIASLSAERCDGSPGFVVGAFDVDMDDELRLKKLVFSQIRPTARSLHDRHKPLVLFIPCLRGLAALAGLDLCANKRVSRAGRNFKGASRSTRSRAYLSLSWTA